MTPPALALWDVDGDSVEDVFLSVAEWTNDTHMTPRSKGRCPLTACLISITAFPVLNHTLTSWFFFYIPVYSAVALSAVTGQVLWKKFMSESVMSIQCGLQYSSQPLPVCLLISKSVIMAVNGTTGEKSTTCVCVCVCRP